jgi:hypothetical protein
MISRFEGCTTSAPEALPLGNEECPQYPMPRLPGSRTLSDLEISLLVLSVIVTLALFGLALDSNWPKVLRVTLSFLGYTLCLLPLRRRHPPLPVIVFVGAGAAAGLISGVVRPDGLQLDRALALTVFAALLLGPTHWLGLRLHRSLRARIVA